MFYVAGWRIERTTDAEGAPYWRATRGPWQRGAHRVQSLIQMCRETPLHIRPVVTPDLAAYWTKVHHRDIRARLMADRHYSRQHPGSPEFIGNGHKIVLLHFAPDGTPAAVWGSHRPAPGKAVRADGRDAWACTLFRVEQKTVLASELIREAVAITKFYWGAHMPADGFYTTINPRKVPPIKVRGADVWGYSYRKAGWHYDGTTKARKLLIFTFPAADLAAMPPIQPLIETVQGQMFSDLDFERAA